MPPEVDFARVLEIQRNIPGSLLEESAAIWCVLLRAQRAAWSWEGVSGGSYLEIGVLHGKSASILASFSRAYGNALTIVDPSIPEATRQTLDAISPRITYIESMSEKLKYSEFHLRNMRSVAFAHIDGMHKFSAVASDLQICEDVLSNFGIISVDDFHTDLYPQIPAATYKYLYSGMSDLCMFLVGMNKAYLCRNSAKKYFYAFSRDHLLPALESLGQKLTLVKSDRTIPLMHLGYPDSMKTDSTAANTSPDVSAELASPESAGAGRTCHAELLTRSSRSLAIDRIRE